VRTAQLYLVLAGCVEVPRVVAGFEIALEVVEARLEGCVIGRVDAIDVEGTVVARVVAGAVAG
jgi:hypothetical protein